MGIGTQNKPIFKTYEQMCLDELELLGKATLMEWAHAMGYGNQNSMSKIVKRLHDDLIITRNTTKRLNYYEVKHHE